MEALNPIYFPTAGKKSPLIRTISSAFIIIAVYGSSASKEFTLLSQVCVGGLIILLPDRIWKLWELVFILVVSIKLKIPLLHFAINVPHLDHLEQCMDTIPKVGWHVVLVSGKNSKRDYRCYKLKNKWNLLRNVILFICLPVKLLWKIAIDSQ